MALPSIGKDIHGNDNVHVTSTGAGHYTVEFVNDLAGQSILTLVGNVSSLRSNGLHAIATIDGGADPDQYQINTVGGITNSLVNVFDSGGGPGDALTVNGTDFADVFLLRAATSSNGLAFIALINGPTPLTPSATDPVERINYNGALETITVNGGSGDDQFYMDDTRASITLNGDEGNDFFQVGQLYKSRRTPDLAGIAPEDVFATIDTTQGWLSNGISKPMTINGGIGDDNFIVFHNLDTLDLNGDAGNDTFIVQAFALAGSQEDHRALTDLSGGAGADHIQYAVDAPVNIDGGDGFDTVIVIGTEFNDDFVITPTGVFGAGLNVNFVNIEKLVVDGGAGDDRFFVLGTGPNFTTEIDGGLGSDLVSVEGPTPVNGVISNTLLGHSGIITNSVESTVPLSQYAGLPAVGVSANVADNDTPGVVIIQTDGGSQVIQSADGTYSLTNGTEDSFSVVLTRPIDPASSVVIDINPPLGLAILQGTTVLRSIQDETQVVALSSVSGGHFTITYTPWNDANHDGIIDAGELGTPVTTDPIDWNAPATGPGSVQAALEAKTGVGTVNVTRTGTSYAIHFQGSLTESNIAPLTATLDSAAVATGGTIAVTTSQNGGFSKPTGIAITFDSTHPWYVPQVVDFVVDDRAETIGSNLDFQNAIDNTVANATLTGTVVHAVSVDMDPTTTGDEYATIQAASGTFSAGLPTATLPDGLRGEHLKITGGEPEAEGQVALVLGSYLTHINLSSASGSTFTLSFNGGSAITLNVLDTVANWTNAIGGLVGGAQNVKITPTATGFDIELLGTLYLTNSAQFAMNDGSSDTASIDDATLKLASAWAVEPQPTAIFEIGVFGDVHVPDVKVKVYSSRTPSIVVFEDGGSTSVTQAGQTPAASNDALIHVRLSSDPGAGHTVHVSLGDNGEGLIFYSTTAGGTPISSALTFTGGPSGTWKTFQDIWVNATDDGVVRGFHRADLLATSVDGYTSYISTVTIGDDHYAGVTVTESNGSTNVVEYSSGDFGTSITAADNTLPIQDSYTLKLTMAPGTGEVVTVLGQAQPTRTSETGGIVSFSQQLDVSLDGVHWYDQVNVSFNSDGAGAGITGLGQSALSEWDNPVTVYVRAHENQRVDGGDTKVFAQQLAQLNAVQGPLFVNGGEGQDRTGLLEREPLMLPGERNVTPSMGKVVTSTPGTLDGSIAATVTIDHSHNPLIPFIDVSSENGTKNPTQDVAINGTSGTFTLTYKTHTTGALAFNAPAVTVENALRSIVQAAEGTSWDVTVAQNGTVYQVTFLNTGGSTPGTLTGDASNLGPHNPTDLVNETILITEGPAKNKTRIIKGGTIDAQGNWVLILDKPWFSPFTADASFPTSDSEYTLLSTNPNLLVDEASQANLLLLYDTDNPASYTDTGFSDSRNPLHHTGDAFASGQIFYDTNQFGPRDENGNIKALDQFRITGFGMGGNRCVGGPATPINASDVEANACIGPVGANEPGGITFLGITDMSLELGAGANHVTVDTFSGVPDGTRAPQTTIDTGAGADQVDVKGITGHTFVNLGAGNDTLNVSNQQQTLSQIAALLTASGDSPQANVINYANGSEAQGTAVDGVDAIQTLTVDATGGTFTLTYTPWTDTNHNGVIDPGELGTAVTTSDIAYNAPAMQSDEVGGGPQSVQRLLGALVGGSANLDVQKAGGVYRIHFIGSLAKQPVPLLVADPLKLQSGGNGEQDVLNINDADASTADAAILTSTSLTGLDLPNPNNTQQLVLDATGGTFSLTYFFPVTPTSLRATQLPLATSPGTLTAGTHYYVVTGVDALGHESFASNEISVVTANSASVELKWLPMPGAVSYRVYSGGGEHLETLVQTTGNLVLDGSGYVTFDDTGLGTTAPNNPFATGGVFSSDTTPGLAATAQASDVQSALEHLNGIGTGNVVVTRNDDVYTIHFQGSLSDQSLKLLRANSSLTKLVEAPGGALVSATASATVTPAAAGSNDPAVNQVQIVTVTAISGTYELQFHVNGLQFTSDAIAYNASAEQVRQAIQNGVARAQSDDPFVQEFLVDKLDVWVSRYPSAYLSQDQYVIQFQGTLRKEQLGPGVDTVTVVADSTGGGVSVATRMDGIDYYGFETVNIDTGSDSEVFNVQGTTRGSNGFAAVAGNTAVTNVRLHNGDDRVFLSSNANLDQSSWSNVDFLTGNLDDFRGTLNIDLGTGRHKLFLSDEASLLDDNWTITGNAEGSSLSIARAGRTSINYTFDATNGGNIYDGVAYWTGSGNDTVAISQIARLAGQRTTTSLNTGLGNDTVTASLADGGDAFFVANLSGGSATGDPKMHIAGAADTDTFNGSASTLSLVVFGGFANDTISGGSNRDIILGDLGRVQYVDPATGKVIAQFGNGGRGDLISSQRLDPAWVYTFVPDLTVGGNDTIYGLAGQDILIGGAANDAIDGGTDDDLIFGDAVQLFRRDVQPTVTGDITNPRFESLTGTQIYSTADATLGAPLNDLLHPQNYRDANGTSAPDWAEYTIQNLYHSYAFQTANDNSWGNDYIAGGAGDDVIFGQLGNDVIQGDGSIDLAGGAAMSCTSGTVGAANWNFSQLVGACRDNADAVLQIHQSADSLATDGSDYIEGGGGSDVIFGNQGQDDIIGGSSDLFSLDLNVACTAATEASGACKRPDAPNLIFGGSGGTDIAQNDPGATGVNSEAHDADTIVANNGRIVRLVGTNSSTQKTGFLSFGYDTQAFEGGASATAPCGAPSTECIVPRAVTLLDYTPGGNDLLGLTTPIVSGNIGAGAVDANGQARGTEAHGGQGDDTIYGGAGNDVLFGDGQNDVLIGGYGNDWISGGNGDDGILGDDGRIFISRVNHAEPLFAIGVDASQNQLISTPGTMQEAVINTTDAVRYTAVLMPDNLDPSHAAPNTNTPRPLYANDVIYGGLGNDALHGGAGDDAMSGAEAPASGYTDNYNFAGSQLNTAPIPSDFAHPYNPGNVLGYSPTLTYQAQYDPNDPFRKITLTASGGLDKTASGSTNNWLLNFNSADGPKDTIWCTGTTYACAPTDGNDALFGDLGNDWLVGGTGRDTMYGGWGNDYLNADDVLNTNGVTNIGTDTNPSYEDIAYGGAGRDVMIANTGGDRLIDWSGEFDSYLTPFAPFGMATVSRTVQPQLPQYLYALSLSDGADPFLAAHYASDPTRNGEPFGELGLVTQQDAAWGDQKGKPRDPQAGNSPGVQRDVLRTSGIRAINSPDTDPPVAAAASVAGGLAAPVVEMALSVSNGDQTLAPLVVTGAVGAVVHYTISDGVHTVTGSGTIGAGGKLSLLVNVSTLLDGTLTATATLALSGLTSTAGTTTSVKYTVLPGSVGLAVLGYVGIAGRTTAPLTITGSPGNYVMYELDGPGGSIFGDGYLDPSTGVLTLSIDLTGYADGVYTVSATQEDRFGNISPVNLSTPTLTLDTVPPTGAFTVNGAASNTALTNNPSVSLALSFGDDRSGLNQYRISVDGGLTWTGWLAYAAATSATLPSPDGTYNVVVMVADKAGNTVFVTQRVILDRTGPTIKPTIGAANNGTSYDVGTKISFSWIASDLNGVASSGATIEGQTISASGGTIDVDVLTAGSHTVVVTAKDQAGNVTTTSLTFTIHPTAQGILKAISDGEARGWITASFAANLASQMQQVIKAAGNSANVKTKLKQFITTVQYPPAGGITAAYQTLLLNWANDLLSRS